jgi:hypothetical protein
MDAVLGVLDQFDDFLDPRLGAVVAFQGNAWTEAKTINAKKPLAAVVAYRRRRRGS